jgi:hypothetical protein
MLKAAKTNGVRTSKKTSPEFKICETVFSYRSTCVIRLNCFVDHAMHIRDRVCVCAQDTVVVSVDFPLSRLLSSLKTRRSSTD